MASGADGKVVIDTQLNNKGFTKGISGLKNQMGGLKSVVGKLGAAIASAFAVRAIVNFGKECVELGSNVAEVQNVVDTAFGDMSYKVEEFAETAIQNFGMSRLAAKKTASTYMAMAKGMGLTDETASDMAISLAGLTGDVASFYNISQEAADTKLKSVFTGETESLKELGVVMTQTNLKAYALKQGITEDLSAMSQAELVALRYGYVMESLALANGDFAKTSDSWANQTRILAMQWEEFMSIIGQALITVLRPCVIVLNQIVASLISAANAVNAFATSIFGEAETQEAVTAEIDSSVESQDDLTASTEETAKAQKKLLAGFDEINKLGSESESDGSGSGSTTIPAGQNKSASAADSELLTFFEDLRDAVQPTVDALAGLWEQLKLVGGYTFGALIDFYNGFLVPVGSWVLGEGLPRLIDGLSNGLAQIDFTKINEALARVWDVLAPFAINVGEGLLWFYENVLVPLGAWVMNELVPVFLERITAAFAWLNDVWASVQPALQWLWDNFLLPIGSYVANEVVPAFFEGLNGVFEAFNKIWSDVKNGLSWLWDNFLQPVADWTAGVLLDELSELCDYLKSLGDWCKDNYKTIEDIALVAGAFATAWGLVNAALKVWNVIGVVATAISSGLGAAIAFLSSPIGIITVAIGALIAIVVLLVRHWDEVKEVAGKCWEWIKDTWSGVADWFKANIIDPITGFFKDFVNGLIGSFEGFVNFIISGVNAIIGALNKISIDIPDWEIFGDMAGTTFGINIPKISEVSLPRLATGSVVPPNKEFMAVLGDNKTETEVVSPLSTMKQAMLEALREGGRGDVNITFEGELSALARVLRPYIKDEDRRVGGSLVTK